MITCYAGLWFLTGDMGETTSIIIFIIILLANAFFGIIWIITYIAYGKPWAKKWIIKSRLESKYVENQRMIPPLRPDEPLFLSRFEFVQNQLLGHY